MSKLFTCVLAWMSSLIHLRLLREVKSNVGVSKLNIKDYLVQFSFYISKKKIKTIFERFLKCFLCLQNRYKHILAKHCVYVTCAQLLSGPLTPHEIHHTHHIYDHLQAQLHTAAPGSLATICGSAFREQFGPPGSCPGPFQHAGCRGRRPNRQLSAHSATSGGIHTKIDAAFSMSA